ncbi:hypothetical protein NMG60_11034314 [Bertholletia excelsa]
MALRWLSLVGAIWLQSISATNSNFPAYSSHLKQLLSISQLQLNNLAFASDAGKLFGWLAGTAAAHLPLWLVLAIGSLLGLLGYGLQFLFLAGFIPSLSYWHVFLLTALAGNSICWINTVSYIISIHNFPFDRQLAVGVSTSYQGLSAKIYTDIVHAVSPYSPSEKAKTYLLLSSSLPLLVCALSAPVVRDISGEKSRRMEGGFIVLFVITVATGVFAVASSFGSLQIRLNPWLLVTVMVVFLLAPLVVPLYEKAREKLQKKCLIRRERRVHHVQMEEVEEGTRREESEVGIQEVSVMEEVRATEMLKRVEFWLYFFVYLSGPTLGLVFLNNLGQIAESRGCSSTSSLVSLSSSFGFFGRLVPSLLDYYTRSKCVPSRPASIAAMMAPMAGSFFLLVNKTNAVLYVSTAVIGVCTGAITSLAVATTTELFGVKNFRVNHNIVVASIPIGSFVFGDSAALVYRKHINSSSGDGRCMGMHCYQLTFVIWGFLCLVGTLLAVVLHARTVKFYSQRT